MSRLKLNPRSRLLIVAPHPDDEALGCGGLIQHALAAGGQVRVIFATDGDNNPWPQRVLERRLRITPHRRKAWGARRRDEAKSSIRTLGLADDDAVFAGLPDQGLTHDLVSGEGRFAAVLRRVADAFKPTLVVGPSINDTHPDHSAIAVMIRLQLPDVPQLEYAIHGRHTHGETIHLTAAQIATKRAAIQCHRTQIALSSRRFLAYAKAIERFLPVDEQTSHHPVEDVARDENGWAIKLRPHRRLGHLGGRFVDLLALADGRIISRRRVRLAKRAHVVDLSSGEAVASGCLKKNRLHIPTHALPARMEAVFAKRTLRFGFFDEAGWRLLQIEQNAPQRHKDTEKVTETVSL